MNDFTHSATKIPVSSAISACDAIAAAAAVEARATRLKAAPRKPSRPNTTAICIISLRRFSFRAAAPNRSSGTPKNAGISAVTAAPPECAYPASPNRINATPKPIVLFANVSSSFRGDRQARPLACP